MPRTRSIAGPTGWTRWIGSLTSHRPLANAIAVSVFAASTLGAFFAQWSNLPITAAIIFLLGVTIVGALIGMAGGLVAALAVSAVYNFFMAEPRFQLSFHSLEDFAPLLAFNASALASGFLTGRLKDRAQTAEIANRRLGDLLALSARLQSAFSPDQIGQALDDFKGGQTFELHCVTDGALRPAGASAGHGDLARLLLERDLSSRHEAGRSAFLLRNVEQAIGVLVVAGESGGANAGDQVSGIVNLTSIALERCFLLEELAKTELLRKSEMFKSALLSSVSHDLRTPLSAIATSASSLAHYGGDLPQSAQLDLLRVIEEQCQRLDRYTTNLLGLSRLQAGLDRHGFVLCDALEALGSAITQTRGQASGHVFVKRFDATEALVRADPVMLEQVFRNVLENAVRYSDPDTEITLVTAVHQERILITIRDRGRGIGAADLPKIFDRFYRAAESRPVAGNGLGLAIARGFTEAFGGRIWAALPDDGAGGTIICIELPLEAGAAA